MKEKEEIVHNLSAAQEKFIEELMKGKSQYESFITAYPHSEKWRKKCLRRSSK